MSLGPLLLPFCKRSSILGPSSRIRTPFGRQQIPQHQTTKAISPSRVIGQTDEHTANTNGSVNGHTDGHVDGLAGDLSDGANDEVQSSSPPTSSNVRDKFDIAGKVHIVTGGGRGLGLAMAEALVEGGATGLDPGTMMHENCS